MHVVFSLNLQLTEINSCTNSFNYGNEYITGAHKNVHRLSSYVYNFCRAG